MLHRSLFLLFIPSLVLANPTVHIIGDNNQNGISDVAVLFQETGQTIDVQVRDSDTGGQINSLTFFNSTWSGSKLLDLADGRLGALATRNDG
ncbi:MAG: hypothetical protein AAF438_21480, partial [Pseudomonadota bacterium]